MTELKISLSNNADLNLIFDNTTPLTLAAKNLCGGWIYGEEITYPIRECIECFSVRAVKSLLYHGMKEILFRKSCG